MAKNSMTIAFEVEGLDEAVRKLKIYDSNSRLKIESAIQKAGRSIRDDAKIRVPIRTGTLKRSIGSRFNSNKLQSTVKADYNKAPHAHLIEYGVAQTAIRPKNKKALKFTAGGSVRFVRKEVILPARKARPFMNPAFQAEKPKVEAEIKKILKEMP